MIRPVSTRLLQVAFYLFLLGFIAFATANHNTQEARLRGGGPLELSSSPTSAHYNRVNVIPQPRSVTPLSGLPLKLGKHARVHVAAPTAALAEIVQAFVLDPTGAPAATAEAAPAKSALLQLDLSASDATHEVSSVQIQLSLTSDSDSSQDSDDESYCLKVSDGKADVSAKSTHGLFNGVMTLSQLPQPSGEAFELAPVNICDQPAMKWRGLMLDVSRHFFPAEKVKKLLHTMALFKLNRFHWHLTDDQGWRVHVDDYPELVKKGAFRNGTQIGHQSESNDHQRYGGFYTDEDVRGVVAYAKKLNIEVIPEVDLPGHVQAVVAAYPQLGNTNASSFTEPKVATSFGTHDYTLAPTEDSFKFVNNVLSEVMDLVPSRYVHIGGDEVSTRQWEGSARARRAMSKVNGDSLANISSGDETLHRKRMNVQALFTQKIVDHVTSKKRTAIVWDEALDSGSLPKDAIVMVWRPGPDPRGTAKRAAAMGHRVILAPQWFTYLDHPQAEGEVGGKHDSFGGDTLSLRKVYEMPVSQFGDVEPKGSIIGGQAQLWTEYIPTWPDLEYMAWPRGLALSEVLWNGDSRASFQDFRSKLPARLEQLKNLGVGYRELGAADRDDGEGIVLSELGEDLGRQVLARQHSSI